MPSEWRYAATIHESKEGDKWLQASSCYIRVFACFALLCFALVELSGPEKVVITKGVFSPEKALESLKFLNSLEPLGNGRNLLSFPQSGGSLETLESLNSQESLENGLF